MTVHDPPHPPPLAREEFLVDGCARCAEYAADLGLHFDRERWRAFWEKMIRVEFDDEGTYASGLDRQLGRKLYYVVLGLQRATGVEPRDMFEALDGWSASALAAASPAAEEDWARSSVNIARGLLVQASVRHEAKMHDGEPCAENRVGLAALVCHSLGLRDEHVGALMEEVAVYEERHEERDG